MIHAEELRIGNRVYWRPGFSNSNVLLPVEIISLLQDKAGYIHAHVEHRVEPFEDDVVTKDISYAGFKELEPIPITYAFIKRLNKGIKYPKWVLSVHELQNWYYWNNEKKELEIND